MNRIVTVLIALAMLIGCDGSQQQQNPSITIGGPLNIAMLVLVAEQQGYFESEKVAVDFIPLQTGKIAQDALVTGDIDIGVLVEANIAYLWLRGDQSVKIIAAIQKKYDDALVVRADRGIATAADMRGRTVGYLPATTSHMFLARYLAANNIALNELQLLAMPPPAMQSAIINGDVDAVSIWQPFRFNAMNALGDFAAELNDKEVYEARAVVAAKESFLDANQKQVQSFLRALIRAEEYVANNPDEAINYLASRMNIDVEALRSAWVEYELTVELEVSLIELITEEGEFILRTENRPESQTLPDYTQAIDARALRAVDPQRVPSGS